MEMDYEIISTVNISTVILPISLIQEEYLSVTGESMCTKYMLTSQRTKPAQKKQTNGE